MTKYQKDEDNKILQNRPENDSAIETANLRNFPDLLRLHNSGQDTNNSGITHSTRETFPPSNVVEQGLKDHYLLVLGRGGTILH